MNQSKAFHALKKKEAISALFKSTAKISRKNLWVRYILVKQETIVPLGVVLAISKKQGNAVRRNRLKRIIRASLFEAVKKLCKNEKKSDYSFHLAISCNDGFEKLSFNDRVMQFDSLLNELIKRAEN